MAADTIWSELAELPFYLRVRRAVALGRQALTDSTMAELLATWQVGPFDRRLLAVYACAGSRDAAALERLAADPSRIIRRTASATLRHVRPTPLPAPIAPDEVTDSPDWQRWARWQPHAAVQQIMAALAAMTQPDGVILSTARQLVAKLAKHSPDLALQLADALRPHVALADFLPRLLFVQRSLVVTAWLLERKTTLPSVIVRELHRLPMSQLIALLEHTGHQPDRLLLRRLAPEQRSELFARYEASWADGPKSHSAGAIAVDYLRYLPSAQRVPVARRMIALPTLATRVTNRLQYATLLPWDEALAVCGGWLSDPDVDYRASALAALVSCTRYQPSRLDALLQLLVNRPNEPDPVRLACLNTLSHLPPSRWTVEHLPLLAQVIRQALNAADLSSASTTAIRSFLFQVLSHQPHWSAEQLALLTRERGWLGGTLDRVITSAEFDSLAGALTPLLPTWMGRERESTITSVAQFIERRLPRWPALVTALEKLVRSAVSNYVAVQALHLLMEHLRTERERLVQMALKHDRSWMLQSEVALYLQRRRQDLLTPFLPAQMYTGRFSSGQARHIVSLGNFASWTNAQQALYATALMEVATQRTQETWDILGTVRRLAELPGIAPDTLIALARDNRPPVREAAVRALGRLDAGQGFDELLAALGDDRARWAMYALRATLADLPAARVLTLLQAVPLTKVTVAKEAIRLAGEFGGAAAWPWLAELETRSLHRDVRAALLRALWDHLDQPAAWEILERASAAPEPGIVRGLARIPADKLTAAQRTQLAGLLTRLLQHPEPTVRVEVLARLQSQPLVDPSRQLLTAVLAKLRSVIRDERRSALAAMFALAIDADAKLVADALRPLLPDRLRIKECAEDWSATVSANLAHRQPQLTHTLFAVVATTPALVVVQVSLARLGRSADEWAQWVQTLAATEQWHLATQFAVHHEIDGDWPEADHTAIEQVWVRSSDASLRWLALETLTSGGDAHGWTAERRTRLVAYCQDAAPMVADAAALVDPGAT